MSVAIFAGLKDNGQNFKSCAIICPINSSVEEFKY